MKKRSKKEKIDNEIETFVKKSKDDTKLNHYVDNKKLLDEILVFKNNIEQFNKGLIKERPRIPEFVGECILKISERLSSRPNFINYTYKDEMISDGIENSIQYLENFNPEISNNPFAYLTQIIYYAFIRRIQKEKKQQYTKMKIFQQSDTEGKFKDWVAKKFGNISSEDVYADYFKLSESDIKYFDNKMKKEVVKKNKAKKKSLKGIEKFQ